MAAQRSARPGPRQRARQGPVNRISEHDNARGARMTRTRSYRSNGKRGKIEARAKPGGGPGRPAGAIIGAGRPSPRARSDRPGRPPGGPGRATGDGGPVDAAPRPRRSARPAARQGDGPGDGGQLEQRPGQPAQHRHKNGAKTLHKPVYKTRYNGLYIVIQKALLWSLYIVHNIRRCKLTNIVLSFRERMLLRIDMPQKAPK